MLSPELPTRSEILALDRMVDVQIEDWQDAKHIHVVSHDSDGEDN